MQRSNYPAYTTPEFWLRCRPAYCCMLIVLLLLGSASAVTVAQEQVDDVADQIQQLQRSMKAIREQLGRYDGKQKKLRQRLQEAEQLVSQSNSRISKAKSRLGSFEEKQNELKKQSAQLESDRDKQQEAIKLAIREAYKQGKQSRIKLILNQQNPSEMERLLKYYEYVNKARFKEIEHYLATLRSIESTKADLAMTRSKVEEQLAELEIEQTRRLKSQNERATALAKLNKEISGKNNLLAAKQAEHDKLQQLVGEIEKQIVEMGLPKEASKFSARKGKMLWPSDGNQRHKFGQRKADSRLRWQGITFAANSGSDVKAVHAGRVVFADWFTSQGLLLIIDHGDKFMSLYAHNASILKNVGDWVDTDEPIATVGESGGQDMPGLYFEIRQDGKPVNPALWCR